MKLAFQLAYRNLVGAGLRTWLNVFILSFTFVMILFFNGLLDGWHNQGLKANIEWEFGNGHLINENYDPYDPFTIQDAHGILPEENSKNLTPILIRQASIYPNGRMLSIVLKGIDENKNSLKIPTELLKNSNADIPVVIGKRMAESGKLKEGDEILMRWRDAHGAFDAASITIAGIFDTDVGSVDNGQLWMPITKLWEMTALQNEATLLVANDSYIPEEVAGWKFSNLDELQIEFNELMGMKRISSSIFYILLLAIALLAIFDTQVLSVFRRQKEIGTYISLGMTRRQVVGLFTVEGSMYSILAMVVGCIYGIPLLAYLSSVGIGVPGASADTGVTIGDRIYPAYGAELILSTIFLVVASATIVSFLPARKIAKMNPVLALKGKLQ